MSHWAEGAHAPLKAECSKKMELPFLLKSRIDEEFLLSRRQVLESLPTVPVIGTSQESPYVPSYPNFNVIIIVKFSI